jgi:hypothetical protein
MDPHIHSAVFAVEEPFRRDKPVRYSGYYEVINGKITSFVPYSCSYEEIYEHFKNKSLFPIYMCAMVSCDCRPYQFFGTTSSAQEFNTERLPKAFMKLEKKAWLQE